MLRERHPGVDLRLTEAEPPEALRMLRAGYVDVALIFRHEAGRRRHPAGRGRTAMAAADAPDDEPVASADRDDLREQVLLSEPVHLIMPDTAVCGGEPPLAPAVTELWPADLARLSDQRWIAGCDRCREHLLRQCAHGRVHAQDRVHHRRLRRRPGPGHGRPRRRPAAGRWRCARPATPACARPGCAAASRSVVAVRYGEAPDPPATALLLDALRAAVGAPGRSESVSRPDPASAAALPEPVAAPVS